MCTRLQNTRTPTHIGPAGLFGVLSVGGCGAPAVPRKTPIYFILELLKYHCIFWSFEVLINRDKQKNDEEGVYKILLVMIVTAGVRKTVKTSINGMGRCRQDAPEGAVALAEGLRTS